MGFPFPSCLRCVIYILHCPEPQEDLGLLLERIERLASLVPSQLLKLAENGFKTEQTMGDFPVIVFCKTAELVQLQLSEKKNVENLNWKCSL